MKQFRIILAMLLLFAVMLPLASCGSSEPAPEVEAEAEGEDKNEVAAPVVETPDMPVEEYSMEALKGRIKLLGERTGYNGSGELMAEWAGSGFEINVNVGEEGTDLVLGFRSNYAARWKVYVDGEQYGDRIATKTGNRKQIIARAIPAGEHTIRLVKDTEPATNRNNYNSLLSFSFNGEIMTPPEDKPLYLEFIGDGYMTGFCNLGESSTTAKNKVPDVSSVTEALPYLTSLAMDADYSIVAHSKIGLKTEAGVYNMAELYNNQYAYRELDKTYKPDRTPDAIVIHFGMDDTIDALPMGKWLVAASQYIETLRGYYNNEKIPVIWIYNTRFHTKRAGEIQSLARYMGEGCNVYALEGYFGTNGGGTVECGVFPNAQEHQKTTDLLVPMLKDILKK